MKIRSKLALLSGILCTLSIAACCAVLIVSANKSSVTNAVNSAVAEQQMLVKSFAGALSNTYETSLSDTTRSSLAKYLFRQYSSNLLSESQYALRADGEYLYNGSALDPAAVLAYDEAESRSNIDKQVSYVIVTYEADRYLVSGSKSAHNDTEYDIYLIRNIEGVYRENAALAIKVAGIGIGFILLSAAFLTFSVFRVLRPLKALERSASAIASGDYQSRLPIVGNDEVAALSASFNAMAEAVEKHVNELNDVAEARKLLLAALTHELKTPMTAIIGYSEALMKTRLSDEQRTEAVSYINAECSRIERLSQKLMQLVALDNEESLRLIPVPVSALFDSVKKTLSPAAEKLGIKLTLQCADSILPMDADLMASVLINLFDNAKNAGARHIMIVCTGKGFTVSDDGRGIPGDSLKRITEPFYMVDKSRSRKAGSVGLGLALVQRIVRLHGGRLHILSEAGIGTTVEITL